MVRKVAPEVIEEPMSVKNRPVSKNKSKSESVSEASHSQAINGGV